MNQNINEKYIQQVLAQSYKFYKKAQEYDSKNETEGALINYLLALNNLNNFKEYMNSLLPNNIDILVDAIFADMDTDKDGNINKAEFEEFLKRNSNVKGLNIDKISYIDNLIKKGPIENDTNFNELVKATVATADSFNKEDLIKKVKFQLDNLVKQIDDNIKTSCGPVPDGQQDQLAKLDNQYCNLKLEEVMKKILNRVVILQSRLRQIKANYLNRKSNKDDDKKEECTIKPTVISGNKLLFEDIIGQEEAKKQLISGILNPILYPRLYPYLSKGILFWGPPGTGKTLIAKALVNEIQKRSREEGEDIRILFYAPTGGELKGKYVGETEKNITKYFKCASEQAKSCELQSTCYNSNNIANNKNQYRRARVLSVLFIDEIEAIAGSRADDTSGIMTNSVNTLLQMMDGVASFDNVIVLGATNYPWKLDSAINRRFGTKVFLTIPGQNYKEVVELIKMHIVNYIRKSLKLDNNTNDLDNGDTLQKFTKILQDKKVEKDSIAEDSKKSKCKDDAFSCYNELICLPKFDEEGDLNFKTIDNLFKVYRKRFFPELTDAKLEAYSKLLGQRNYTQGDVKNIMRAIFKTMGGRAIKGATEKLTVFIGGNDDSSMKKELKLYNHQAIDYFNQSADFANLDKQKKFTFNYYDPCGSQLPKSGKTNIIGDDLMLFTTDAYNTLLDINKIDNKGSIIEIIDNLRKNFIDKQNTERYSDFVEKLLTNQFGYISHFINGTDCPETPSIDSCGETISKETFDNDEITIDYLNESLHLYIKEYILGNIFRDNYIPVILEKYFGLELFDKALLKTPNSSVQVFSNYKSLEGQGIYLFSGNDQRIAISSDRGGSMSWNTDENVNYIMIKKNKVIKNNDKIIIKLIKESRAGKVIEQISNEVEEIIYKPRLLILIGDNEKLLKDDNYSLIKLKTVIPKNSLLDPNLKLIRLNYYDENKKESLELKVNCDIDKAKISLDNEKTLWGGSFNKFLPQAEYNHKNNIGYLVLYWLGYDLKQINYNKTTKKFTFNKKSVKEFIDKEIIKLSNSKSFKKECLNLGLPIRSDKKANIDPENINVQLTNLVVLARRNYLKYIHKSLKIIYNNVISITSFIQGNGIIGKYILLNDVITQLITLDLNHLLKLTLSNSNSKDKIFKDKITTIRGIFHQDTALMVPVDLNEKFNLNYNGEVYLRYSMSSKVDDFNPVTYNTRNKAINIKNKDTLENWFLEDKTGFYTSKLGWKPWYAGKIFLKGIAYYPMKISPSYFNFAINNPIKNTDEAEEKLRADGYSDTKHIGKAAVLGGVVLTAVLIGSGPLGWALGAGAAVTGGLYAMNRLQNQKILNNIKNENIADAIEKLNKDEDILKANEDKLLENINNNPSLSLVYDMHNKRREEYSYIYESFYNCVDGIICADQQSRLSLINDCINEETIKDSEIDKIFGYLNSIYPLKGGRVPELSNYGFEILIGDEEKNIKTNFKKTCDLFRCNEFYLPSINCIKKDCSSVNNKSIVFIKRALSNNILIQNMFLNYNSDFVKNGLLDLTLHFNEYINLTGNSITDYNNISNEDEPRDLAGGATVEGVDKEEDDNDEEEDDNYEELDDNVEEEGDDDEEEQNKIINNNNNQINLYGSTNAVQGYFFTYDKYNYSLRKTILPKDIQRDDEYREKGFIINSNFAPSSKVTTYDIVSFILSNKKNVSKRDQNEKEQINNYIYPGNKEMNYTPNSEEYLIKLPHRPYLFCNTQRHFKEPISNEIVQAAGSQCDLLLERVNEDTSILDKSFKMSDNKRYINFKFNPEDFQYAINTVKNLAAVRPSTTKEHIEIMTKYQQNSDLVTKEELKKIR